MVDEKIAIVIPMKLNNERLPNKSFQSLKGLPLCHWTYERCITFKQNKNKIIKMRTSKSDQFKSFEIRGNQIPINAS